MTSLVPPDHTLVAFRGRQIIYPHLQTHAHLVRDPADLAGARRRGDRIATSLLEQIVGCGHPVRSAVGWD